MSGADEMREAVARAITTAHGIDPEPTEDDLARYRMGWRGYMDGWLGFESEADAAIKAVYAWLDANGWAVVPKAGMTAEMSAASGVYATADEWRDMLTAAPKAPGRE